MTDDCKKEVAQFRIELGESINRNLPLGKKPMHLPLSTPRGTALLVLTSASFTPCLYPLWSLDLAYRVRALV